jgi:hypothetical protein
MAGTLTNAKQFLNVASIFTTLFGILGALTNLVQFQKVPPRLLTPYGIALTPIRFVQPLKALYALLSTNETPLPIFTLVTVVLSLKVDALFTTTGEPLITSGIVGEVEIASPTQLVITLDPFS